MFGTHGPKPPEVQSGGLVYERKQIGWGKRIYRVMNSVFQCKGLIFVFAIWMFCSGKGWAAEGGVLEAIENEITAILETNRQGVVRIHALYPQLSDDPKTSGAVFTHGTGFVFDTRGYILTIDAAVQGAKDIRVILSSGDQIPARMVGTDPISGVAVIRTETKSLPAVSLGNSERIRIGHYAFILGNDFGNLMPALGSVHEIFGDGDLLQITARVQSSYGGAPVFCSNGKVGGMVWRYEDPSTISNHRPGLSGWGETPSSVFVIPINRAMRVAHALVKNGVMAYGWLGVEVAVRGNDMVVLNVAPDSPARSGGIKPGDVLLTFENRPIAGPHHLKRLVMETLPGTPITLSIQRNGRAESCQVRLGALSERPVLANRPEPAVTTEDEMLYQQINHLQQEMGRLLQMLHRK